MNQAELKETKILTSSTEVSGEKLFDWLFLIIDIDEDNCDDEFEVMHAGGNAEDDKFDVTVGALQEILMDEDFERMQKEFSNKHCLQFEATEENKLVYTDIFKQYQELID